MELPHHKERSMSCGNAYLKNLHGELSEFNQKLVRIDVIKPGTERRGSRYLVCMDFDPIPTHAGATSSGSPGSTLRRPSMQLELGDHNVDAIADRELDKSQSAVLSRIESDCRSSGGNGSSMGGCNRSSTKLSILALSNQLRSAARRLESPTKTKRPGRRDRGGGSGGEGTGAGSGSGSGAASGAALGGGGGGLGSQGGGGMPPIRSGAVPGPKGTNNTGRGGQTPGAAGLGGVGGGVGGGAMRRMFGRMDADGDGRLDRMELRVGLHRVGVRISQAEFALVWRMFDRDGDGQISYAEFAQSMSTHGRPEDYSRRCTPYSDRLPLSERHNAQIQNSRIMEESTQKVGDSAAAKP